MYFIRIIYKPNFTYKDDEFRRSKCNYSLVRGYFLNSIQQAPADGAAALLIAHEEAVRGHDLRPLARIVGWTCVGVDPMEAGIGGARAVQKLLERQNLRVDDVDLFEVRTIIIILQNLFNKTI